MAFLYRGVGTAANGSNSAGPLSPTLPSGVVAGDLLIVHFQSFGGTNSRVPSIDSPWTSYVWSNGTANHLLAWKIAGSSESNPSITLTGSGVASDTQVSRCFAFYTDLSLSNYEIQLDAEGTNSTNASADNIGPVTGITVGGTDYLTIISAGKTNDFNGQGALTDWTQAALTESTTGNDAGMSLLYRLATPSGATGDLTVNDSGATNSLGLGFGKILSFREVVLPITGDATSNVELTTSGTGDVTAPAITGSATSDFGITLEGSGSFTSLLVPNLLVRPTRRLKTSAPFRKPKARFIAGAAVEEVISSIDGTASVSFELTSSGTGTVNVPTYDGSALVDFGLTGSAEGIFTSLLVPNLLVRPTRRLKTSAPSRKLKPRFFAGSAVEVSEGLTGSASVQFGLTTSATGTFTSPAITGDIIVNVGLTSEANAEVIAPPITGSVTTNFDFTITALGIFGDIEGVAGRGVIKPTRRIRTSRRKSNVRGAIIQVAEGILGISDSVDGSATSTFGLTVSATGDVPAYDPAFAARGIFRPTRPIQTTYRPPRVAATLVQVADAILGIPSGITINGSVSFGLNTSGTGTYVSNPTGAVIVNFGLTSSATGTYTLPAISGSGTANFGLTSSGSASVVPAGIVGDITATLGLVSSGDGTFIPNVTGSASSFLGLIVTGSGDYQNLQFDGAVNVTFGLITTGSGTVTPPQYDGAASLTLGLLVTGSGVPGDPSFITATGTSLLTVTVSSSGDNSGMKTNKDEWFFRTRRKQR